MNIFGISLLQFVSFLLIFIRVAGFIFTFQPISSRMVPAYAKVSFAIAISLAFSQLYSLKDMPDLTLLALFSIKEFILGIIIGFLTSLVFFAFQIAGQIIDFQVGLSLANVINPSFEIQSSPIGDFLFVSSMLVFLVGGWYVPFIEGIGYSFNLVPLGNIVLKGSVLLYAFKLIGDFTFQVALRFVAPIITLLLLVDIITGIIARTVPQINVFIIGLPLKTGLSFLALTILISSIPDVLNREVPFLIRNLLSIIRGFA
ncbi:MAG: flagellar biosynthetic protein FliR [bacterium]